MMTGLIFDLDQTLVDSRALEPLRNQRQWGRVLARINEVQPFIGIPEIIAEISASERLVWSVVTSSPSMYAKAILTHLGWDPNALVAYHDTVNKKPHAEPTLKAVHMMGCDSVSCHAFGDMGRDIVSANGAGVRSVACLWGSAEEPIVLAARPVEVLRGVADLVAYIKGL